MEEEQHFHPGDYTEEELYAIANRLAGIVKRQEELLNRILQPGERWLELSKEWKARSKDGFPAKWLFENGKSMELAEARVQEAITEALKEMVKK